MKLRRSARDTGEVPASALSDIAFLLIIFFIIVTVFAPRIGISVLLRGDERQAAAAIKKGEVIVLEGKGVDTILYKNKKRTPRWVRNFLLLAVQQQPDLAVRLKLEPSFRYGLLVKIAAYVNKAGIADFRVEGGSVP